ncbi:hypothetical protein A2291_06060 [candidate division WOR-1 bacterium RIFOXYB2_FULL_42_35]|uniref:AAA+ ATPase domain-containing protein n=1 Tax=candidate division WOR-1 bacterium RIFOXYC2_FULL_41_25 TaxID=1802586 RepID=A0A1F4TJX9_UNCSA|nr:MAG: hypothetical protein A2247_01720 [candidate division WOR-1 bacterium RIFOXYA2_FULL_41_14]OGC22288.1 MAG: hypothetical protein A2291_06060 [candidate division WOR-1 bacterium RIFOXYB2_FULL_42_35]OGC32907.1 MAG: hypothetical protein A2462_00735 [candidate division WOR-1 bacterium RIFOXYC2_FULL_41_25]OGC41715.1 MAG: hypothetical protein A2548_04975 [candidate division WOR-1 bacterium RIFOXYD2_FULL_41_8]
MEETLRKLNELRLHGLAKSFHERIVRPDHRDLSFEEFLGLLVDDEFIYRRNLKQCRLLQRAKLKFPSACLEEIDYRAPRGLIKSKIVALQNLEWLNHHQNILITGPSGVGKSHLACALGQWLCRNGRTVLYSRWPRLFGDILASKGQGNYLKHLDRLAKVNLLIIDDFGLSALNDSERKDFLEIVEDRYTSGSTIITSQLPVKEWHTYIGEPTIADAICDRLFHVAHKFELKGESMRKKLKKVD